jgi:upstream activation factor subunit UAF30
MAASERGKPGKKKVYKVARSGAFMAPLQPSKHLGEIVGHEPLPRTEATRIVWVYIRQRNLQDPNDKRFIRADKKLKMVFGGQDRVSMFELSKHVNRHLMKLPGGVSVDP